MRRKLVYLAGPFGGDLENNLQEAVNIAAELVNMGYVVICPHANSYWVHLRMMAQNMKVLDPILWYEYDFELLRRCDILVLMPKWKESTGARLERAFAEQYGIRIYVWGDKDKSLEMGGIPWEHKD